jgi:signal transduction histidine kinase
MMDERLLRLERLLQISRALGTAHDEGAILSSVISSARELTNSQAASVVVFDGATASLHFLAGPNSPQHPIQTIQVSLDNSAAGWVLRERKSLLIPDLRADIRRFSAGDLPPGMQANSLLAIPLMIGGKVLGVLEAVNKNSSYYTEEDTTILETVAALAAISIQNGRLQTHIDESLTEVSELDRLKNNFIGITSHELRTPLGVILGQATLLRESVGGEYHQPLDVIIANASKLIDIVDDLIRLEGQDRGVAWLRPGSVSLTRIIEEVIKSFSEMASKRNIALEADLGPEDVSAEADGSKVSIALSNLVKNAIMFIEDSGHVLVKGESHPDHIKVSVIDDGLGIPAKDQPRIFERFFQVESHLTRRHGGMGLGLSVAKVMIEAQGGRIWVESVEGQGSNFSFTLPIHAVQG